MTTLSLRARACAGAATGLGPEDTARFLELHDSYTDANLDPKAAAQRAAADLVAEIASEAADLTRLVADLLPDPAAERAGKIADFGEKIIGARKDYATLMKEARDVDVAAEPLSKSWPEPDYQKLLDGGADPFMVAFIHAARDEVPTKPQKSWKLKGWVESVKSLRSAAQAMLDGEVSKERMRELMAQDQFRNVRNSVGSRAELYGLVGHGQSLKGVSFAENHYTLYRGQENVRKWVVEQKAKATAFSNWPRELAVADTKAEMLTQFMLKLASGAEAATKAKTSFVIWRQDGKYAVGKKLGSNYVALKRFDDLKEARKHLAENAAELEAALKRYKATPFERNAENAPRVGADHRNGASATQEAFADAFKFRGVQFGNYVEQSKRQSDLDRAFDALMDLAGVLDVPSRALSLNGQLGLAFGARGHGGKDAAAAHYEPNHVVINLTKESGAGALAHELFHALDNYFAKLGGGKGGMMTEGAVNPAVRPEMVQAFKGVQKAIAASEMRKRSRELDKRKSKPYWATHDEMAARAFEAYVIAKLQDQSAANDYLANIVSEDYWKAQDALMGHEGEDTYPYPTPAEMGPIREAFDNFFKTIETREDDAGNVAMFSRRPGTKGAQFNRERAIANLPANVRESDDFGPERTDLSGDVHARAALWERLQDFGQAEDFPAYSLGVDDIGNITVGAKLEAGQYEALKGFADGENVGIYVLRQAAPMTADNTHRMAEAGYRPTPGLATMAGEGRASSTNIPMGVATYAYKPRGISEYMFSRTTQPPRGVAMQDAQAVIDAIRQDKSGAPTIIALEDVSKSPDELLAKIRAAGAENDIEGAYHDGTIYVYPQHWASIERGIFVTAHHELRHHGFGAILGKRKGSVLVSMYLSNENLRRAADKKIADGTATSKVLATEEALADMPVEQMQALTGWDKIVAAVRQWLRDIAKRLGINGPQEWTDNDIAALVQRAEDVSRGGGGGTMFSRDFEDTQPGVPSRDQTDTPAFKRWFGDSKVVDAAGKPLVVYHGTSSDFNAFDPEAEPETYSSDRGKQFFTSSSAAASEYAANGMWGEKKPGANVMPVYLRLQNPLVHHIDGSPSEEWDRAGIAIWNAVEARNHDGAIVVSDDTGERLFVTSKPEQIKSATGNRGTFDPTNPDIRFSRAEPARDESGRFSRTASGPGPGIAQNRPIKQQVRNSLADMLGSAGAKVSWWDKTLGTQYAKAAKFPAFKRVFDLSQQYLEDTSTLANEAADLAPGILPKLETWKDLKNFGIKPEDARAIAAPIFTGTLTDQRVYDNAELVSRFKLTPPQIAQYRQFLAAVNASLDQAVTADVLRAVGDKNPALRELAITERAEFRRGVDDYLAKQAEAGDTNAAELRQQIQAKYDRIDSLKTEGYAPLMRFGQYKVHVADAEGETLFFGLYESRKAANEMARELAADPQFKDARIEQGVLSQEQYKLFSAMPLDSLEMFAQALGAEQSEVFQDYIRLAKNNRSALKRLIHRKGTAGFSEDVPRVLASFVTSNARMAAGAMNLPGAKEAAGEIRDGDVQDEAIKLVDAVQNPRETAGMFRGLMFMNFIGGSIASAAVNLTQPLTMTLPYLSQFGGLASASARLLAAGKMAASGKVENMGLRAALKRAEHDGVVSPQEIHHLTAQAMGAWGTSPWLQKAAFVWAAPFSLAEQFNRRVTFIAAWNTAKEQGETDPFAFAEKAVIETQGLYSKANAPNWARNPLGASALTFKQFSIHYLEWMGRMYRSGPEGKKAVAIALALLILAAGTDGLPFAEDLDDLVDTLGQALGYDTNSKRARRDFVANTLGLGDEVADAAARGLSTLSGVPMDVSLRMSMGNLIPASGILLRSNTDRSRDVLEIAGPAGGIAKQYLDAGQKALRGDAGAAVESALPVALQNVSKATGMWSTGEARDTLGRKVMEADEVDGLMKFMGFNPAGIARESQKMGIIRRSEQLAKNVEGEIASDWARAFADGDSAAVADARQRLADWNADNPASPIRISGAQIAQRVKKLRQDRAQRFITSASPERRRAVQETLQ